MLNLASKKRKENLGVTIVTGDFPMDLLNPNHSEVEVTLEG